MRRSVFLRSLAAVAVPFGGVFHLACGRINHPLHDAGGTEDRLRPAPSPTEAVSLLPTTPVPLNQALLRRLSAATSFVSLEAQRSISTLHEWSVPGTRFESLEEFLLSPATTPKQELAGLARTHERGESGAELLVLTLSRPMTLAFSRISAKSPILIRSNGHALRIVSHDLSRLGIDGNAPGKDGSSVEIVTTGDSLPAMRLAGADGRDGRDAACPTDLPGDCLSEDAARRPRKAARTQVPVQSYARTSRRLALDAGNPAHLLHLNEVFRIQEHLLSPNEGAVYDGKAFHSCEFKTLLEPMAPLGIIGCRPLPPAPAALIGILAFDELTLEPVRSQESIRGVDGEVIPAEAGQAGFSGGSVRLTSLMTLTLPPQSDLSGGKAGLSGRHGILEAGSGSPPLLAKVEETRIRPAGSDLKVRWIKRMLGMPTASPSPFPPFSETEARHRAFERDYAAVREPVELPARFNAGEFAVDAKWNAVRTLPAGEAGRPAAAPTRIRAAAGAAGKVTDAGRPETLDSWLQEMRAHGAGAAKQELPLPLAMARALAKALQDGKVSP